MFMTYRHTCGWWVIPDFYSVHTIQYKGYLFKVDPPPPTKKIKKIKSFSQVYMLMIMNLIDNKKYILTCLYANNYEFDR